MSDITIILNEFYKEWNNRSQYWFCKNEENDKFLSLNFGFLIDDYDFSKNDDPIIAILIYDQLTRHFYRNEYSAHIITYFNNKALNIALQYKNEEFINFLCFNDWMFYMLVFRHTNIKEHLFFVMNEGWKLKKFPKQFLTATYNRANFDEEPKFYDPCVNANTIEKFNTFILDSNPIEEIFKTYIYEIGDFSVFNNNSTYIVSLSGGVDSVCCLFLMVKLFKHANIIAVHINYNNRKETNDEVIFLKNLCNRLKVKLYVRTITEIYRQKCILNDIREVYESYTKKVRFNTYKKVFNDNIDSNDNDIPIVILGHNKDDCFENILTNIAYKNKYENLIGIEYSSVIDGINFIRPLINIDKKEIYNFANVHNLPYLQNSTPEWCQRGKIRADVIPNLEKWDSRFIDGMFNINDILKDFHISLKLNIKNFKNYDKMDISLLNTSFLYWKYGIFEIYKFYPSNKSLNSLIERLKIWKNKYNNVDIHKISQILINKKLILQIWKCKNNIFAYNFIYTP